MTAFESEFNGGAFVFNAGGVVGGSFLLAHAVDQLTRAYWMFATVNQDEDADPLDPPRPRSGDDPAEESGLPLRTHSRPGRAELVAFFMWAFLSAFADMMICRTGMAREGNGVKSQVQRWSSWRSREFVVREAGDTGPIVLAVRGVLGAAIDISSLRRTETTVEGGGPSATVWGAGRRRFIVPSEFDSVDVFRRSVGSSSTSGFGPWKVTRLADEEIELVAGRMSGRGPWVLRVEDSGKELRITWNEGKHPGTLTFFGPGSGGGKEFHNDNRTRETISVTGPGYLLLDADHWTLESC